MTAVSVLPASLQLDGSSQVFPGGTKPAVLADSSDSSYLFFNYNTFGGSVYPPRYPDAFVMQPVTLPDGALVSQVNLTTRVSSHSGWIPRWTYADYTFRAKPKNLGTGLFDVIPEHILNLYAEATGPTLDQVGGSYAHDNVPRTVSIDVSNVQFNLYDPTTGSQYRLGWNDIDLTTLQVQLLPYTDSGYEVQLFGLSVDYVYKQIPLASSVTVGPALFNYVLTGSPTVSWVYSNPEGDAQSSFRVVLVQEGTFDSAGRLAGTANFDPNYALTKLYDTGYISGSQTSYATIGAHIQNQVQAYAYVQVRGATVNAGTTTSHWAASAKFTVQIIMPPSPTLQTRLDPGIFSNIIDMIAGDYNPDLPVTAGFELQRSTDSLNWEPVRDGVGITTMDGIRMTSVTGNYLSVPSNSYTSFNGDIDIRMLIAFETTDLLTTVNLASKLVSAGNQCSWQLQMNSSEQIVFKWSEDGVLANMNTVTSNPVTIPSLAKPFWIRVRMYTDSAFNISFYTNYTAGPDANPNTLDWGNPQTVVGSAPQLLTEASDFLMTEDNNNLAPESVPGVYASTAPVQISGIEGNGTSPGDFRVHYFDLRKANGSLATMLELRGQDMRNNGFYDILGNLWVLHLAIGTANQARPFHRLVDVEILENTIYQYRVTATGYDIVSNEPISSDWVQQGALVPINTAQGYWWVKPLFDNSLILNADIDNGGWDAHIPAESAAFSALGRDRKLVVFDVTQGREGSIVIECLTEAQFNALEAAYRSRQIVYIHGGQHSRYVNLIDWTDKRTQLNGYSIVSMSSIEVDKPPV